MSIPPRTLGAYRRTVFAAEGVEVRIGRRSLAMDALLRRHGSREAVFVTAWNPFSRRMAEGWNRRMQAALVQSLGRRQVLAGQSGCGLWQERQLLALGDPRPSLHQARLFRQHAVVLVGVGRPARLWVVRACT